MTLKARDILHEIVVGNITTAKHVRLSCDGVDGERAFPPASSKASIPMGRGFVKAEGITSLINPELCTQCGLCSEVCPFGAIIMEDKVPRGIPALCKGCGTCAAECRGMPYRRHKHETLHRCADNGSN